MISAIAEGGCGFFRPRQCVGGSFQQLGTSFLALSLHIHGFDFGIIFHI